MLKENLDLADGQCESCSIIINPQNLYVDLDHGAYSLKCPHCFYRDNPDPVAYYHKVKTVIPEIYTQKKYNEVHNDITAIGDALIYAGRDVSDVVVKNAIGNELAKEYFDGEKKSRKFIYVSKQYAFQTQLLDDGHKIELLMLKAKVQFRSYIEFLEHELYKAFRRECGTVFE